MVVFIYYCACHSCVVFASSTVDVCNRTFMPKHLPALLATWSVTCAHIFEYEFVTCTMWCQGSFSFPHIFHCFFFKMLITHSSEIMATFSMFRLWAGGIFISYDYKMRNSVSGDSMSYVIECNLGNITQVLTYTPRLSG